MRRTVRSLGIAILIAGALGACDAVSPPAGTGEPDESARYPETDVQLPPVPTLDLAEVPHTYDDGSHSVFGLVLQREELRDTEVRVTGIVQSIYECEVPVEADAEPLAPGAVRPGCNRPHLYIADSLRSSQRMLVTGYDAALYEPQLQVGNRYVVQGVYRNETRGFISSEDGLLVASAFEGDGIVIPPEEPEEAP